MAHHPLIAYPMSRDTLFWVDRHHAEMQNGKGTEDFLNLYIHGLLHVMRMKPNDAYFRMAWRLTDPEANTIASVLIGKENKISLKEWVKKHMGIESGEFMIKLLMEYIKENNFRVKTPRINVMQEGDFIRVDRVNWKKKTVTIGYEYQEYEDEDEYEDQETLRIPKNMQGNIWGTLISWSYLMEVIATVTLLDTEIGKSKVIDTLNKKSDDIVFYDIEIEPNPHFFTEHTDVYLYYFDKDTLIPVHDSKYGFASHSLMLINQRLALGYRISSIYYHIGSKKCYALKEGEYSSRGLTLAEVLVDVKADKDGVQILLDGQRSYITFGTNEAYPLGIVVYAMITDDKVSKKFLYKEILLSLIERISQTAPK